jgi:hypothetical protein
MWGRFFLKRPHIAFNGYPPRESHPQCRDVSWNVLKEPARGSCRMGV